MMTDEERKVWLAIRKEGGLKIDAETAEVEWAYAQTLDPYGVDADLPEELQQMGREYFAVLPAATCGSTLTTCRTRLKTPCRKSTGQSSLSGTLEPLHAPAAKAAKAVICHPHIFLSLHQSITSRSRSIRRAREGKKVIEVKNHGLPGLHGPGGWFDRPSIISHRLGSIRRSGRRRFFTCPDPPRGVSLKRGYVTQRAGAAT
jgi:hypothetical protein